MAEVEELVAPVTLTRAQILCWPIHDSKTKGDGGIPWSVFGTWSKHDIIRVYGL